MLDGLASDLSMTWMSWSTSSPLGRGRVTSSATSLAASSSWRGKEQAVSAWRRAARGGAGQRPTHQLQMLGRLLVQEVGQVLIKAGQVLHLHLDPVLPQVVMPLEFIPGEGRWQLKVGKGAEKRTECWLRCTAP